MRRPKTSAAWAAAAIVGIWLSWAAAIPAAAQTAAERCAFIDYAHPGTRPYRIREVRIESKIDFLQAISSYLKGIKGKLPLQAGKDYPLVDIVTGKDAGRELIEDELRKAEMSPPQWARVRSTLGRLENCDQGTGELDVVYRIFLTNYDDYLSHTWELKSKEVEEPGNAASEPKATQANGFLTVKPTLGYNRTRRGFGGLLLRLKMPGGLFETAELKADGSPTSDEEEFELAGSRSPNHPALNRLDYRLSYKHSNVPAGANKLREATLSFQAFGASKPLGERGVILRYGASIEGGNQHTALAAAATSGGSAANSGYGGLKAYVGTTMRVHRLSLAASYGIQLGTRGATAEVDFVKHLGDLALTTQFWKREGKPGKVNTALTVEARLAVGTIQSHGPIPVTQRFFGGNAQRNFIEGDNWRMLSGPFIRSLPENRLNSSGEIGGTRFYSANLTVAHEIWGYPLMPKEMKEEPGFVDKILPGTVANTYGFLRDSYLVKVKEYVDFIQGIPSSNMPTGETLNQWLEALSTRLNGLPGRLPDTLEQTQKDDIEAIAVDAHDDIAQITSQFEEEQKAELPTTVNSILVDQVRDCRPTPSQSCTWATTLRFRLEDLAGLLDTAHLTAEAAAARADAAALLQKQNEIVAGIEGIDVSLAENLAKADTKVVKAALDAFTKELNVVAVSPVGVFDVARVWPDRYGTRYGAGGGLRLSLFNLNATLGYSFNLNRQPGDGRGAVFFALDFTDIFR